METTTFEAGQVWQYHNRSGEEESALYVLKVEPHPLFGQIVHIGVMGLKVKNPAAPGGFSDSIQHMPMSPEALKTSVVTLLESGVELPDFKEGYKTWKKSYDAGEGGVFTIAVAECIEAMETAINSQ